MLHAQDTAKGKNDATASTKGRLHSLYVIWGSPEAPPALPNVLVLGQPSYLGQSSPDHTAELQETSWAKQATPSSLQLGPRGLPQEPRLLEAGTSGLFWRLEWKKPFKGWK